MGLSSNTQKPEALSLTHTDQPVKSSIPNKYFTYFKKLNQRKILIPIALIAFLLIASLGILYPKAQAVKFAGSTRESLSELLTNTDSVNTSLNNLFTFATGSGESDVQLSRSTTRVNKPIDSKTNGFGVGLDSLLRDLSGVFKNLDIASNGRVSFGGKVKGFTTPANDPNKIYRDQRDLAVAVKESVESSHGSLTLLEEHLLSLGDSSRTSIDLKKLISSASAYLDEAGKTADYYVLMSDLSIELEGNFNSFQLTLQSAHNVNSLVSSFDEVSKDLKELKGELEFIGDSNLPSDIEDLHKDSVELFDIVINYFDKLKVLTLKEDSKSIVDLTNKTSVKLNQSTLRGINHEISFWKNNRTLNSYETISSDQTKLLKQLEEKIDRNNLIFLRIFGVR